MEAGWSSLLCFRLEFLGDAALGLAFHRIRLSMKALSHSSAPSMSATKSCASSSATPSTDSSVTILRVSVTWYWRKREKLVERTAVEILKGDIGDGQDVLVGVHSECLTGDVFGSARCDCGNQMDLAMQLIEQAGRGVALYLRGHEGR